jgi:AAA ATPase domain
MNEAELNPHQHVNPYIAGSPVTGTEMFYGREDVFSFIRRNLIGRHRDTPVVLYGQRRTGKTSVLYQLHRHLDPSYRCIFIDLHGLNLHGMGNLILGIAGSIRRGLQRDHDLAVEVPDRAAFLSDPRSAFEAFLDRVWAVLGNDHLVLMLDEVIRLDEEVRAERLERDIFEYLRHLMQHHPRLNFIFSLGSGLEELAKDYAFLFSVSLYHRISFLEPAAAVELIIQPARDHYQVAPQAVTRILQITSGHPYYTQLVCHCIFDLWSRFPKSLMSSADVDTVMAEAIELGSANLTYVWEDSSREEQALMAGMAAAMRQGAGPVTVDQVREAWREAGVSLPEHEVARALRSLISREVIAGTQAYFFTVDLQRIWLEKHRRLDLVKDQLEETVRQWNRSVEPWPVDSIPSYAGGPEPSAALEVPHARAGRVPAGAKLLITRGGRRLAVTAAVMVALACYLATAGAAHIFPFRGNPAAKSPPQSLTQLRPGVGGNTSSPPVSGEGYTPSAPVSGGCHTPSPPVSSGGPAPPSATVPDTPSSVTAVAICQYMIRVTWADASADVTGFNVDNGCPVGSCSPGSQATLAQTIGPVDSATFSVTPGTYQCFEVQAFSSAGKSAWSDYACTSTPGLSVPATREWTDTGVPVPAGDLGITAGGQISISLAGSEGPKGDSSCTPAQNYRGEAFPAPYLPCWSLIARIGSGPPFEVGTSTLITVGSGILYLGINGYSFSGNSGSWTVNIKIGALPPSA